MNTPLQHLSLFLFSLAVGMPLAARACSCAGGSVFPLDAAASSDLVFLGTVSQILSDDHSSRHEYVFEPTEVFVGEADATEFRLHGDVGSSCNVGFRAGETYLVYAHSRSPNKGFSTHDCTRTRRASSAALDLLVLRGNPLPEIPIRMDLGVYDGHVSLSVYGGYGRRWNLEVSSDLTAWSPLESFDGRFEGGFVFFFDQAPGEGSKFYRVQATAGSDTPSNN